MDKDLVQVSSHLRPSLKNTLVPEKGQNTREFRENYMGYKHFSYFIVQGKLDSHAKNQGGKMHDQLQGKGNE